MIIMPIRKKMMSSSVARSMPCSVMARVPMSTATPRKATATRCVQKSSVVQITVTNVQTAITARGVGASPIRCAPQPTKAMIAAMNPTLISARRGGVATTGSLYMEHYSLKILFKKMGRSIIPISFLSSNT